MVKQRQVGERTRQVGRTQRTAVHNGPLFILQVNVQKVLERIAIRQEQDIETLRFDSSLETRAIRHGSTLIPIDEKLTFCWFVTLELT